jgi:hypothetical protein
MKIFIITISISLLLSSLDARTVCKQFANWQEAQSYFDAKKKGYKSLDRDKDGKACECLNGGPSADSSNCKRWKKRNNK